MKKEQMEQIRQITKDIEAYQAAIRDAEGALDAAERELDEVLQDVYQEEMPQEDSVQGEPVLVIESNNDSRSEVLIEVFVSHNPMLCRKMIIDDELPPF